MVMEAVKLYRNDVFARRAEVQARRLQHRRRKTLWRRLHAIRCGEIIDSHRPGESTAEAETVLQVRYRLGVEQRAKHLLAMLDFTRDHGQQGAVDARHPRDIIESERCLNGGNADTSQRFAPRRRAAPAELIDGVGPQHGLVPDCAAYAAHALEIGPECQGTHLHLHRGETESDIRLELAREIAGVAAVGVESTAGIDARLPRGPAERAPQGHPGS